MASESQMRFSGGIVGRLPAVAVGKSMPFDGITAAGVVRSWLSIPSSILCLQWCLAAKARITESIDRKSWLGRRAGAASEGWSAPTGVSVARGVDAFHGWADLVRSGRALFTSGCRRSRRVFRIGTSAQVTNKLGSRPTDAGRGSDGRSLVLVLSTRCVATDS